MKIALISCTKRKSDYTCIAGDMYKESNLFKYSYEYAKLVADKVYILSAKYGLISEFELIEPYDLTLKNMKKESKILWSNWVLDKMKEEFDIQKDEFVILAGKAYYENLINNLTNYRLPLENLALGKRIQYLKILVDDKRKKESDCLRLHKLFNQSKIYRYDEIDDIPYDNGIYIMFEKGQDYQGLKRIVRVGTHNKDNRLKKRLKNHYQNKNKDGSIFRKNIGIAILNKKSDDYLSIWKKDTSLKSNKIFVDKNIQNKIECEVSDYIQENIVFTTIRVDNEIDRIRLEEGIIATLNKDNLFHSNEKWLGNYSTESEIKKSGMWLKRGLNADVLNINEINYINNIKIVCNESNENISTDYLEKQIEFPIHNKNKRINNKVDYLDKPVKLGEKIEEFINNIFEESKLEGKKYIILKAGEIHKNLKLKSRVPAVCGVMKKLMKENDEILYKTKSEQSTTFTVKYYI